MDSTTKVIKDSIEVFSSILDASTCALVLVQENGIVAYANNAVFEMFGLIPEAIIGKHLNILLVPTTRQKHQQHFDKFFSIKKTREMGEGDAFPAQHKSGKVIYVTIGLKPVTISGEDYVLATITKAAKLNAATNTLAKATANLESSISDNKRLLEVAQNSSDAVFLLNQEAQINWINKAASSLINQSLPDLADVDIVKLVEQSSLSKDLKSFRVALSRGNAFNGELVVAQLNESPIQVSVSLQPVFETNLLQGFSCTFRDITSRRELEAQMRENNELLETTARIANLGFYSLDIASNNLTWSEEVYNIHELPRNTSINVEDAINYYAPEGRGFISAAVERCINTGESFDLELPFITARKRKIWVRSVGYAEFNNGKPIKLKGAFQNITSMRQAALNAEQAALAKSNFLANMSHELRTPINGILGISEVLSESELNKKQDEYVSMISSSADSLLFLVNQVLDYAKLNSGSQKLSRSIFNITKLVTDKTYIHRLAAREKGCEFEIVIDNSVPSTYYNDSDRVGQILNNLCSNAVKFTNKGKILVSVELKNSDTLLFSVRDTGPGIKQSDMPSLFKEFQQLDDSYSREHQGTGLGLTISKQLVELMQGEIGVQSDYGKGSNFYFSLPIFKHVDESDIISNALKIPNAIILTANTLLNQYWSEIANKHRSKLKVVNDMPSLLSSLKQDKNWQLVVIIDLPSNIPVMTSIKSIKRFLSSSHYLLVNSSLNLSEDTDSIEQSNPNYISIEFDKANPDSPLKQQCYQQFISIYNWQESLKTNYSLDWSGKSILVAEDNLINQVLFKEMLTHTSVTLHIVGNGQEAVDYLNSNNDVDLVIMDCQMPVMDGFDATKQIRANQNSTFANIKVIAATAHGFDEDIQACFDSGMNEVLVKPFSKTQLIDMIAKNL